MDKSLILPLVCGIAACAGETPSVGSSADALTDEQPVRVSIHVAPSASDWSSFPSVQLAFDAQGNALVAFPFAHDVVLGGTTLTSAGETDVAIAKIQPSGSVVWATQLGGSKIDRVGAIAVDASGDLYVGAEAESETLTFGRDTVKCSPAFAGNGFRCPVVVKVQGTDGSPVFARGFSGTNPNGEGAAIFGLAASMVATPSGVAIAFPFANGPTVAYQDGTIRKLGAPSDPDLGYVANGVLVASLDGATGLARSANFVGQYSTLPTAHLVGAPDGDLYLLMSSFSAKLVDANGSLAYTDPLHDEWKATLSILRVDGATAAIEDVHALTTGTDLEAAVRLSSGDVLVSGTGRTAFLGAAPPSPGHAYAARLHFESGAPQLSYLVDLGGPDNAAIAAAAGANDTAVIAMKRYDALPGAASVHPSGAFLVSLDATGSVDRAASAFKFSEYDDVWATSVALSPLTGHAALGAWFYERTLAPAGQTPHLTLPSGATLSTAGEGTDALVVFGAL